MYTVEGRRVQLTGDRMDPRVLTDAETGEVDSGFEIRDFDLENLIQNYESRRSNPESRIPNPEATGSTPASSLTPKLAR